MDEEFFEKEEKVEKTVQEMLGELSEDDFLDIVEGRKVEGIKITK